MPANCRNPKWPRYAAAIFAAAFYADQAGFSAHLDFNLATRFSKIHRCDFSDDRKHQSPLMS